MEEFHVGGDYKLRLSSKKLKSGKCQVKFHASLEQRKNMYGYILVDSGETLTNVVQRIYLRLDQLKGKANIHHINLYSIGKACNNDNGIIMFDA